MKVVPLSDPEARGEVVEILRDLLELAESGELVEIAACGVLLDRSVVTMLSSSDDIHRVVGAIERLRLRALE